MISRKNTKRMVAAAVAIALSGTLASPAGAITGMWTGAKLTPANPTANVVTSYSIVMTGGVTNAAINCIKVTVDSSSAFDSAGLPGGFAYDSGSASAISGSFVSGTWADQAPSGKVKTWTNATGATPAAGTLTIANLHNPTASGSNYIRVQTFGNVDCSTTPVDSTDIGFVITDNTLVYTHVDPTLVFTVAGRNTACNGQLGTVVDNTGVAGATAVNLGNINQLVVGAGSQDLSVTTNAQNGAAVYVRGLNATKNLRNGGHQFLDSGATPPAASTEAFGYTTATLGSNVFATLTNANAAVASSGSGDLAATCIGFQASASSSTPAGDYTATVIYTAVPTY